MLAKNFHNACEAIFNRRTSKRLAGVVASFRKSNFGLLHQNPTIILTSYRAERSFPFLQLVRLLKAFPSKQVHIVNYICNYLPKGDVNRLRKHRRTLGHELASRIHFMTNTNEQLDKIMSAGFSGFFCSHNALIDESIFKPLALRKKWNAIYDAQFLPCKRHELAIQIQDLLLIFSKVPKRAAAYQRHILSLLPEAKLANITPTAGYRNLEPVEVNELINQSFVGLCLSAREGAMYASVQYLLAGIPVVTTPSLGGRDEFFDYYNSILVSDSPEAVYRGVLELRDRQCHPEIIRKATLDRVWQHRRRLFEYLERLVPNCEPGYFEGLWPNIFYNKLTLPNIGYRQIKSWIISGIDPPALKQDNQFRLTN